MLRVDWSSCFYICHQPSYHPCNVIMSSLYHHMILLACPHHIFQFHILMFVIGQLVNVTFVHVKPSSVYVWQQSDPNRTSSHHTPCDPNWKKEKSSFRVLSSCHLIIIVLSFHLNCIINNPPLTKTQTEKLSNSCGSSYDQLFLITFSSFSAMWPK